MYGPAFVFVLYLPGIYLRVRVGKHVLPCRRWLLAVNAAVPAVPAVQQPQPAVCIA